MSLWEQHFSNDFPAIAKVYRQRYPQFGKWNKLYVKIATFGEKKRGHWAHDPNPPVFERQLYYTNAPDSCDVCVEVKQGHMRITVLKSGKKEKETPWFRVPAGTKIFDVHPSFNCFVLRKKGLIKSTYWAVDIDGDFVFEAVKTDEVVGFSDDGLYVFDDENSYTFIGNEA
jgi:hypothetical protein